MSLILFIDALPHNYVINSNSEWKKGANIAKLEPNIGYSSNLHWQLFDNTYPDEIGFFTDWSYKDKEKKSIKLISNFLEPLDKIEILGVLAKKILDRFIYKKNVFANIPFKHRKSFYNNSKYLFFETNIVNSLDNFKEYKCSLQDENNKTLKNTLKVIEGFIEKNETNILGAFGIIDFVGHKLTRCETYNKTVDEYMEEIKLIIDKFLEKNPNEGVLIVSDHGMSNVNEYISIDFKGSLTEKELKKCVIYTDSAIMRIYCEDSLIREKIHKVLTETSFGHLLTEEERIKYGITSKEFGDFIFNLYAGYMFKDNWFGKSLKGDQKIGMHGYWPGDKNQDAVILTYNYDEKINEAYSYNEAYKLITKIANNK